MDNGVTLNDEGEVVHVDKTKCKRMDCHLDDTKHWHLLGYFKEYYYMDWFEQLFKHEGYCVWQNDEADFMCKCYG